MGGSYRYASSGYAFGTYGFGCRRRRKQKNASAPKIMANAAMPMTTPAIPPVLSGLVRCMSLFCVSEDEVGMAAPAFGLGGTVDDLVDEDEDDEGLDAEEDDVEVEVVDGVVV